jgi:hypothetical protein
LNSPKPHLTSLPIRAQPLLAHLLREHEQVDRLEQRLRPRRQSLRHAFTGARE